MAQTAKARDEKPLPHNNEAEEAVLGACMLNPNVVSEVRTQLTEADFYDERNRRIFQCMAELDIEQTPVDMVTVLSKLNTKGLTKTITPSDVAELSGKVPTSANVIYYANIVKEFANRRRIIDLSARAHNQAFAGANSADLITQLMADLERTSSNGHRGIVSTSQAYPDYEEYFKQNVTNTAPRGLSTGFPNIDRWLDNGIEPDMTVTIGARSADGKSTFTHNLAVNIAMAHGPGLLVSLEESARRVLRRIHRILAPNSDYIKAYEARDVNAKNAILTATLPRLRRLPLFIDDSSPYIEDLRFSIRAHMLRHPETTFVAFDYLQIIRTRNDRLAGRDRFDYILDEMMEIKRAIQRPIFILSQFRKGDIDPKVGPTKALLKETGRIENDSDIIFLLFDPSNKSSEDKDKNEKAAAPASDAFAPNVNIWCDIAKCRDGRPARVRLIWHKPQYLMMSPGQQRNDSIASDQLTLDESANPVAPGFHAGRDSSPVAPGLSAGRDSLQVPLSKGDLGGCKSEEDEAWPLNPPTPPDDEPPF